MNIVHFTGEYLFIEFDYDWWATTEQQRSRSWQREHCRVGNDLLLSD